ncbi:ATP-binding protein [Streptomyces sp. NPDC053499]|uniref:ATP-binding protein n=1 Tax=Streptomyces sp. NPDC053499 TaxID=3365707 RepID=UPI0037D647D3
MTTTAIRPHAIGAPGYSETWPCEAESVSRARSLVSAAISTWGLSHLIDDGTLVVSELVTNAVQHTDCSQVRVSITLTLRQRVRIAVSDRSIDLPEPNLVEDGAGDEEAGRGLLLVELLADYWDVKLHRWGKTVWADLLTVEADRFAEGDA